MGISPVTVLVVVSITETPPQVPRKDQRAKGDCYLRGLMLDGRGKSIQPMAARLSGVHEQALNHFVANSPWGVRMTKEVAWSQLEIGSLQAGIDMENRTQIMTSFTEDSREAMAAFVQKRPPAFVGR